MAQLVARLREGLPDALGRSPQNCIRLGGVPTTSRNDIPTVTVGFITT